MLDMSKLSTVEVTFIEEYKKGIVPSVMKPWQEDLIDILEGREPYKESVKKKEVEKKVSRPSLTKEERENVYNAGGVVFMGTALVPGML